MANQLESCKESIYEEQNEYKYLIQDNFSNKELRNKYNERYIELYKEAHARLKNTFKELAEHFYNLWD